MTVEIPNRYQLSSRRSLITGSCGLLGYQHAQALLEVGSDVILTDISEVKLSEQCSFLHGLFPESDIRYHVMDVSSKESVLTIFNILQSDSFLPDVLINNAAIDPKVTQSNQLVSSSRLEYFPLEDWNFQISVGLTGAYLCSQIFGLAMAQSNKRGVILNIASDLSVIAPDQRIYSSPDLPLEQQSVKPVTYSVIKHGLIGLTKYIATYWANNGVRCNALSPGGVYTTQSEEFVSNLSNLIPMKRMANIDEYRSAVQFLCSDASAYMNGHNLIVDGGRSIW